VVSIFRAILRIPLLRPLLRPITRFLVGTIAIPLFRMFLRRVVRLQELDRELEKDLEQWFRGALVLLVASANMEQELFGWVPLNLQGDDAWVGILFRLLLAVGVIEAMPDQELFAVIHPGPPTIRFKRLFTDLREKWREIVWGAFCKHLNRSSPVFVIMTAILLGPIGWICYVLAIVQYLIIGLVTSRDKAMDVLSEFDKQVAQRRQELLEEFEVGSGDDKGKGEDKGKAEEKGDDKQETGDNGGDETTPGNNSTPDEERQDGGQAAGQDQKPDDLPKPASPEADNGRRDEPTPEITKNDTS